MKTAWMVLLLGAIVCAAAAQDRVMEEALSNQSTLERNLQTLTDEIGGRIPGTPQYAAAEQWAKDLSRRGLVR